MKELKKSDLKLAAQFSINDNMGGDYWLLYHVNQDENIKIVHFSQSVKGWESERWLSFKLNDKNQSLYEKIIASKNQREQCRLMMQISTKEIKVV